MGKLKELLCWSPVNATKDIGDYSNKERNFFLVGLLGQNLIYAVVGSVVQVFYTDILIVPALAVSVVMGVSRVWDAANDLLMGTIVDKTHTRWGKCRPYLKFIPIPVAIATVLMFLPITAASVGTKIFYIIFSFLLFETLYTLGDIPLWGMTSLMTPSEEKRAKLIAAARIIGSFGALAVVSFYPLKDVFGKIDLGLFANTGKANANLAYFSEPQGYLLAIILVCVIGGTMFRIPFAHVRERIKQAPKEKDTSFAQNLKLMWENKFFLRAVLSSILGCTRNIMLSAGIYFCKWVLGNGGNESLWLGKLGGPFLVGTIIAMNRSTWFAKKFSKKRVYLWSCYLNAIPYLMIFIVGYKHIPFVMAMMAIGGFMNGFTTVYNTTMVADSVDYMEWKVGKRSDGVFFSGINFTAKLSTAITAVIVNLIFFSVNYTDTVDKLTAGIAAAQAAGQVYTLNFAAQYPTITSAMLALITLVPAAGCILQALPIHGYKLTEDVHGKIMEDLAERRKETQPVE